MKNIRIAILVILCASLVWAEIADSNNHDVSQVQKKLKELGYDPGAPDGIWGKKTTNALKRFQEDSGLPVTGRLDEKTREKLITKKRPSLVSFIEAIKKNDIMTVKALVEAGADINAKDKSGEAPLHIAAVRGYRQITSLLIAEGADINTRDARKLTPLHAAAWGDHKETVALLIAKGANINARDEDGVTPLHVSALSGGHKTMALLINKGADINARNKYGMTPLHAAALAGQKEAAKLLIDKGADVNAKNNEGVTPLQVASHEGHQSIVELLQKF